MARKKHEAFTYESSGSAVSTGSSDSNATAHLQIEEQSDKPKSRVGPLRAPLFIRQSSRMDYQPDICKDYKETGYCGYGDSCKFLHDRGDYKTSWQIEKEWELAQKDKAEEENYEIPKTDEDEFPFACFICRNPFENPIQTKCGHYFCEKCARKHHEKNKKCFVCHQNTFGIFNIPHKLIARLKEREQKSQ